jgi:hypothetical protein
MNTSNEYCYWCINENKNICEVRSDTLPVPDKCKNDVNHVLKANSIFISRSNICVCKSYTGICNHDMSHRSDATITLQELAKYVKCLAMCLEKKGIIELE